MTSSAPDRMMAAFRLQIEWCERLGSAFMATLLSVLADDVAAAGVVASLTDGWLGDPVADAVPLRLAASLHALVLMQEAAELAECYPPHATSPERLRSAVRRVLADRLPFVRAFLASPPQTNEVGRSAVLLGGFLEIAAATGLPFRLLEIGASAGLNTMWDRYGYRIGGAAWGDPHSPVQMAPQWEGTLPPLEAAIRVTERLACDLAPIDLDDAGQRLRLAAYVWADQGARLSRLQAAIAVVRKAGQRVERADAADWVRSRLQEPAAGCATVLYHSIMWGYLPASTQAEIVASLEHAADRATEAAPLAWLRFEPPQPEERPELRLTLWPGGVSRRLAVAQAHGAAITWGAG